MRVFAILFVHMIVTLARLARPGGLRSVVAESVLLRHQLLILNRGRKHAPNLCAADRIIAGLCTLFVRPTRILRAAIGLRSSTLLHLHNVLKKRKYRMLFSRPGARRPGPKSPNQELIDAVVAMKQRNPRWGCPRIAHLRILEVTEIKTVPYVPLSHPFVERLIGTLRREYLDRTLFWTTVDLYAKLAEFRKYYNGHRTHAGLEGGLPEPGADGSASAIDFESYRWRRHCRGLFQTPIAA